MSAGICGKRLGFEEIFGSTSSSPPSAKRSRYSRYSSPVSSSDFVFESEDKVSFLLSLFPSMDRKVVETILNAHDDKIDDAIKSVHALCIRDVSAGIADNPDLVSGPITNSYFIQGKTNDLASEKKPENSRSINCNTSDLVDGSPWVDMFVQEMTKASNWDDVRVRVTGMLNVYEKNVSANCKVAQEQEFTVLKEQLQSLSRENQILKRAVTIQHERNLENDAKLQEIQQLKLMINQYQEQVRTLELNNYTLKVHLQRAQEATSSIPNRFHPDIF